MHVVELERSLRQLHLSACLVSDELTLRADRLLQRRRKQARFRDPDKTLDNFDFNFNPKMNRSLVFDLATGAFIAKHEDALFLGPGGTARVTWLKPSGKPPFCKAIKCCIAKCMSCWISCLMPMPRALAKNIWN